jgi:hypothetical protein
LNDDLKLERECKLNAQREEQRERELLCTDTSTVAGHTKEVLVASDSEILKIKGDSVKFQKDATILKFPSSNKSDEDSTVISKSDAKKHAILQISQENSQKLLLLASALENTDNIKKMSDSKLQKRFLTVQNS